MDARDASFKGDEIKSYIFAEMAPFVELFVFLALSFGGRIGGLVGGRCGCLGVGDDKGVRVEDALGDALEGLFFDI